MLLLELAELFTRHFTSVVYAIAAVTVGVITYRLYLHPLRRYPGPFLAKITDLYGGVLAWQKRLPLVITALHEQKGSVIRLGPNRILFNSATAFQEIYRDDKHITKSFTYALITRNGVYSVFNTLDNNLHRAKRKVISQAFSKRAITSFEPVLIGQVDIFIDLLRQAARDGTPMNMSERLSYLAIDIIGMLSMGYELGTQTSDENRVVKRTFALNFYITNIQHHLAFTRKLVANPVADFIFRGTRERLSQLIEKMVRLRLSLDIHARPDLFSFVAADLPKEAPRTRDSALWKEALTLLTAGGDTVASAMTGIFFYLSRNRQCYERVAEEVRSKFSSGEGIKGGVTLQSCRYLAACIEESLRMSPPAGANLWRQQVVGDNTHLVIDGHPIPKGVLFGVNIYALSHNPDIFSDPFTYNPDRWLSDDDDAALKKMQQSFASFSIGSRDCVGKQLAYLEMMIVVAKTLWYFDFEKAGGELGRVGEGHDRGRPQEFETHDGFNTTHDGPYLVFSLRDEEKE